VPERDALMVVCSCPDSECAKQLAERIVSERLAACANVVPGVTSIFEWNGALQSESEVVMVIKTTSQKYPQLEATLRQLHPYEVPEIIATPITHGLPDYLDWVTDSVEGKPL